MRGGIWSALLFVAVGLALIGRTVQVGVGGGLGIRCSRAFAYEDSTAAFLQLVSDEATLALRNARSYEAIEDQRRRLELVNTIGRRLASSLDRWSIMRTLREELASFLDFDGFILATITDSADGPVADGYQYVAGLEEVVPPGGTQRGALDAHPVECHREIARIVARKRQHQRSDVRGNHPKLHAHERQGEKYPEGQFGDERAGAAADIDNSPRPHQVFDHLVLAGGAVVERPRVSVVITGGGQVGGIIRSCVLEDL